MEAVKAAPIAPRSKSATLLDFGIVSFQRILAVIFLLLTILVWLRAVGFWEGSSLRFDTMNTPTKVYTALLAVLFPVSCVGLWTTLSWGRVVWFLAAGVQLVAFTVYSGSIAVRGELLSFHVFAIALYLAMRFGLYLIEKKE